MNKKPIVFADIPLPDSTELERQVLADCFSSDVMLGEVIPLLHPDFFSTEKRRRIWDTIVDLYGKGEGVDIWSVASIHGQDFTGEVMPYIATAGGTITCLQHANLLRNASARRRMYKGATSMMTQAISPANTEADILAFMSDFIAQIEGPAPLQAEQHLSTVISAVKANVKEEEALKAKGETMRISSGFRYLDGYIGNGFKPGQLVILAARPSVGKTAVMLQMAKAAAKAGNAVEVFSLEMTGEELGERLLYSTGKVLPFQVSYAQMEWQAFEEAEGELKGLPIYVNDFSRNLADIVTRLTQAVKQGRCKIAFIDYLGLIQDALNLGQVKLYQIIAKITGTLKGVAKRLRIPIVLLCQLNREQVREKRSPELYDLRDSGSIEQDADVVIMLEPKPEDEAIYAWLRKNRNGKRDIAFVLKPNATYSEFKEEPPFSPIEKDAPSFDQEEEEEEQPIELFNTHDQEL